VTGLPEVSNILWRERHLLDLLLFKLDVEQTLLASGRMRWLSRATNEVEMVLEEIRSTELARAVAVAQAAAALGLGESPSLRELAEAAPSPWGGILAEHRTAFLSITEEISLVASANRDLAQRSRAAVSEVLGMLAATDRDPFGATQTRPRAILVDEIG
jgi:hypothetical protein